MREGNVQVTRERWFTALESSDHMSNDDERVTVPLKDAIRRIGRKKYVHTFMQGGPTIIGGDHDRAELIAAMRAHGVEESGPQATAMGHTLVIVNYPVSAGRTTPLWIEAAAAEALPVTEDAVSDQTTGSPSTIRDSNSS